VVTFLLVPFATVASFLPVLSVGVLAPFVAVDEGIDPTLAGVVAAVLFVVAGLVSTRIGGLADRFGPHAGLTLMFGSSAVAWWLLAGAEEPLRLGLGLLFAGACIASGIPTATILCFRMFEGRTLRFAIGITHAGTQVGAVLTGGVLPVLVLVVGWRHSLRWMGGLSVIGLAFVLVLWRRQRHLFPPSTSRRATPSIRRLMSVNPGLARLAGFMLLFNTITNAGIVFLPTYANQAMGLEPSVAARTTMVMGLASIAGKLLWGFAANPREGRRWFLGLAAVSFCVISLLALAPRLGPVALWVGAALFGGTVTTWTVPATRVTVYLAGSRYSGTAASLVMTSAFLGGAAGPPLFAWALSLAGFASAWGGGLAIIAASTFMLRRRFTTTRPPVPDGTSPGPGEER
jgi:MFS transporter, ACS family, hexuronate transporter